MIIIGDGGHAAVVREVIQSVLGDAWPSDEIGFVAVGNNRDRKREVEAHPELHYLWWAHKTAWVSPSAEIGEGTIIMAGAVVQAGAKIGKHVILNSCCSVDHHAIVEDFAHIGPGAHLCGNVQVGEGALVGVGVGLAPGCRISAWHLVKAQGIVVEPLSGN